MVKISTFGRDQYRLPNALEPFQEELYIHLIRWKWANLTREPGYYRGQPYDALLPETVAARYHPLYPPIVDMFRRHQRRFHFKSHKFLGHMASSQAACANLFLPLLQQPGLAAEVLRSVKPDLGRIATERLDSGFRIEFWDEPTNTLGDHNPVSGTDADIAIAYYNDEKELCLWLIEHKLTEAEFTTCGGYKSKGRTSSHSCQSISRILEDPNLCYYHSASGYGYWDITLRHADLFDLHAMGTNGICPFMGGANQLWRNQLLGVAVEESDSPLWPYRKVYFSVVHHPRNPSLAGSMRSYQSLLRGSDRFSSFTSDMLLSDAKQYDYAGVQAWAKWYEDVYYI